MFIIPKGTKDVLPSESYKWHYVENIMREVAREFCINEIRTPTFEHTELFLRGVGDTTDVVNKEMYTFIDKGNRSITLKCEGTAGAARSFIENSLISQPQPIKTYYITPVFRYERPQSGRLREHHQFGVEMFGSYSPLADVEVIMAAKTVFDRLGITDLTLNVNSIGCKECRKEYNKALKVYLNQYIGGMCDTCKDRIDKNPLRILDCKEERCKAVTADAPKILDYLCGDCKTHHKEFLALLDVMKISYVVNPMIVRGLDYYTRTVFEFISNKIGAQGTVSAGGRYNNLVEEVGGKPCPAVGFGMGIERLLITMENLGLSAGEPYTPDVYVAPICAQAREIVMRLVMRLRNSGLSAETDFMDRSVKAQMKYAGKLQCGYTVIIGESEIAENCVNVKNMATGESENIAVDKAVEYLISKCNKR